MIRLAADDAGHRHSLSPSGRAKLETQVSMNKFVPGAAGGHHSLILLGRALSQPLRTCSTLGVKHSIMQCSKR